MELLAVEILSVLTAVALLAAPLGRATLLCAAAAFVATAAVIVLGIAPALPAVALAGFGAAAVALAAPGWVRTAAACGGALAALSAGLLHGQGLPWVAALPSTALAGGAAYGFARRSVGFAPARMREEGLLMVATLDLLAAVGPALVDGWQTALALRSTPLEESGVAAGSWLVVGVVACAVLGGAFALWGRRA